MGGCTSAPRRPRGDGSSAVDESVLRAIRSGDTTQLETATQDVTQGRANVNYVNAAGDTPLIIAASKDTSAFTSLLLTYGATVDYIRGDGQAALHFACEVGAVGVVTLLTQAGAHPDTLGKDGWTPLHFACKNGHAAICVNLIQILEQQGSVQQALSRATTNGGWTPLQLAATYGHAGVCQVLLSHGASVFDRLADGMIPLHQAAAKGYIDICKALIHAIPQGTDPSLAINARGKDDFTPLMFACRDNNPEVCRLLVSHGCDVNAVNSFGDTALIWAAYNGHVQVCKVLHDLAHATLDYNYQSNKSGDSALHMACKQGQIQSVARFLVQTCRVNYTSRNKDGDTPEDLIISEGNKTLFKQIILEQPATSNEQRTGDGTRRATDGSLPALPPSYEDAMGTASPDNLPP